MDINRIMGNFAPRNTLIIKMTMKRRDYTKPTTKVVMLKNRTQLLQSSPAGKGLKSPSNYDDGRDPFAGS